VKRGEPLRRRTRIAQRSPKRIAEADRRREVIAEVVARDGPGCKALRLIPGHACWGPLDPDEYDQRGTRPGGHLDPTNVQMLCRAAHTWATEHQLEAARLGLKPFPRNYTGPDGHADRTMPL
jgi:hypothetical protein